MAEVPSRQSRISTLTKREIGSYYETVACEYLQQKGLTLIARNSQFKLGEIDLIMQEGDCFVFVEVRYRRNDDFGHAAATVNVRKQQKIIESAKLWLQSQGISPDHVPCRFDVFAITGRDRQWIINAFGV